MAHPDTIFPVREKNGLSSQNNTIYSLFNHEQIFHIKSRQHEQTSTNGFHMMQKEKKSKDGEKKDQLIWCMDTLIWGVRNEADEAWSSTKEKEPGIFPLTNVLLINQKKTPKHDQLTELHPYDEVHSVHHLSQEELFYYRCP